jgi:chromosome segregation protein
MYLKSITISGFKSFSGKYKLDFEPGIIGIVGPNGSGKSNVADAIRWVLGEQSYKLLRAKKSEDIIFAGSTKKPKSSYAEVSLLLDNSDDKVPIDYREVEITRRLYRSGDSDYLINGRKTRLLDVQELLAKSGFGRSSYSVVGQGMVDQLLFLSSEERKNLFTEATGVKHFEIQKEQAEKKLISTHDNLCRAQDILSELEPRLRLLKSQFKKASLRDEVEVELRDDQKKYYSAKWQDLKKLIIEKEKEKNSFAKDLKLVQEELNTLNLELEKEIILNKKKLEDINGLRADLEDKTKEREKLKEKEIYLLGQIEIKKSLSGVDFNKFDGEIKELEEKIKRLSGEIEALKKEAAQKNLEVKNKGNFILKLNDEIRLIEEELKKNKDDTSFNREIFSDNLEQFLKKYILLLENLREASSIESVRIVQKDLESLALTVSSLVGEVAPEKSDRFKKIAELEKKIDEISARKKEIHLQIENLGLELSSFRVKIDYLEREKGAALEQISIVETKIKEAQESKERLLELDNDLSSATKKLKESELVIADYKEKINLMEKNDLSEDKEREDDLIMVVESSRQAFFEARSNLEQRESQQANLKNHLNQLIAQIENAKKAIDESIEISQEVDSLKDLIKAEELLIVDLRSKLSDFEKDLFKSDETENIRGRIKNKENLIKEITADSSSVEIEYAKLSTKMGDLEEEIMGELKNFRPESEEFFEVSSVALDNLRSKIDKLKIKLMSIGEIDPLVKEEYGEVSERFQFLSGQIEDLSSAQENLKKLTQELEKQIKEKFDGSFGIIAENFSKYFEILFMGGAAKIKQTADGNIDIWAKPPGKKIENINALSGGERTLTALSLLAAILDLNPSPFVVLDEVDAALDEVNTEKFLKIIKELSIKSQFIFITHNRGTMKVADLLYGVTMDENHASSLLSIKMESKAISA